jgi:hypothetical protein
MVWIAENPPYDADDKKLLKFLNDRVGVESAKKTVLLFSLFKYLKSHSIRNPKDIETSAYYDRAKTHPVFTPKLARSISNVMKQSGGAGDDAIILDRIIRGMIRYIQTWMPSPISGAINTVYSQATILKHFEQMPGIGEFIDIGKEALVQGTTTVVVGANDIATDIGGPAGAVAVAIPSAIATFAVVITHVLDDELGEALLVSFLAVPFIGPTLYKAAGSLGKVGRKMFEHKGIIVGTTRSFLGDGMANNVDYLIPKMDAENKPAAEEENPKPVTGAKRFSTRRRKVYKWKRTRSARR